MKTLFKYATVRRYSPYNYAFNNPVFFIDPDGMMPISGGGSGMSIDPSSFGQGSASCTDCGANGESITHSEKNGHPAYIGSSANGGGTDPPVYNGPSVATGNAINPLPEVCIGCNSSSGSSYNNGSISTTDVLGIVEDGLDVLEARQKHLSKTVSYKYGTTLSSAGEITSQARSWHNSVAKNVGRSSVGVQVIAGSIEIYNGIEQDGGQFGRNAQRATAGVAGGMAGAWAGAEAGAVVGAAIGVWFVGVGAAPGALIGGVIGGIVGGYAGSKAGEASVDYYYKEN